jgi:hypothetical protein
MHILRTFIDFALTLVLSSGAEVALAEQTGQALPPPLMHAMLGLSGISSDLQHLVKLPKPELPESGN